MTVPARNFNPWGRRQDFDLWGYNLFPEPYIVLNHQKSVEMGQFEEKAEIGSTLLKVVEETPHRTVPFFLSV